MTTRFIKRVEGYLQDYMLFNYLIIIMFLLIKMSITDNPKVIEDYICSLNIITMINISDINQYLTNIQMSILYLLK